MSELGREIGLLHLIIRTPNKHPEPLLTAYASVRAVVKVETTPGEEDRIWFVGIDVSEATLDAAALSTDGEIDRLSVKNTGQGHAELVH